MEDKDKSGKTKAGKERSKIVTVSFEDTLKFVDADFKEVLVLLNKYGVFRGKNFNRSFKDRNEVADSMKKIVGDYLIDKYNSLYSKISDLRKKGKDMTETSLKLSAFKLKFKLFEAGPSKRSFNKIIVILEKVKKEIESQAPRQEESKEKNSE